MNPSVSDPDFADVGAAGLVDDFLQNLFRRIVRFEAQIAVPRTRVDQDRARRTCPGSGATLRRLDDDLPKMRTLFSCQS